MYQILLVDDEDLIRGAIAKKIRWDELGYELCGTCKNGKEAIEILQHKQVNLVLTDICMPYIDGLELSKFIYEHYPETKVIILSGYSDFEYAKKAVKYRVVDYVLKPVTMAELSEILLNLNKMFRQEEIKEKNIKKLKQEYMKNLPLIRARYLNQLVHGQQREKEDFEIKNRIKALEIYIPGIYYKAAIAEVEDIENFLTENQKGDQDLPSFILFNILEEMIREKELGIAFQNLENKTVIILGGNEKNKLDLILNSIFNQAKENLEKYFKLKISLGAGGIYSVLGKLKTSYQEAETVLEYRFLYGNDILLDIKDFSKRTQEQDIDLNSIINSLIPAIKLSRSEEINEILLKAIKQIREARLSQNRIYIYMQNILTAISNLLEIMGLSDELPTNQTDNIMHQLYKQKTLQDVQDIICRYCIYIGEKITDKRNNFAKKQAMCALDYIEKNYHNSQLTLQVICNELSISPSYFSSIFKSYTGETFIEALTKKRMNQAKELLKNTSLRNYEIADRVGFSDPHYFALIFKKYTGMTPKEYAKEKKGSNEANN